MTLKFGIFESLCANYGLGATNDLPDHFVQEGNTMMTALCDSLAMSHSVQPVPIIHRRWTSQLELTRESIILSGKSDKAILEQVFEAIKKEPLAGLVVIAPELLGELTYLVSELSTKTKVWNCRGTFLDLACDKWSLSKYCRKRGIPHPRTELLTNLKSQIDWEMFESQVVIKPRDGAGCVDITIFDHWSQASDFADVSDLRCNQDKWIVQDWIAGRHASRSLLCDGHTADLMPLVGQDIVLVTSTEVFDERIPIYLGANPLPQIVDTIGKDLLTRIFNDFEDQCMGWIGFDLLIPEEAIETDCYLIEINPRFTTSFAYVQNLYQHSLLDRPIVDFLRSR